LARAMKLSWQSRGETCRKVKEMWRDSPGKFSALFPDGCQGPMQFPHTQRLDWKGLRGLLLSSSCAPKDGSEELARVGSELRGSFDEF